MNRELLGLPFTRNWGSALSPIAPCWWGLHPSTPVRPTLSHHLRGLGLSLECNDRHFQNLVHAVTSHCRIIFWGTSTGHWAEARTNWLAHPSQVPRGGWACVPDALIGNTGISKDAFSNCPGTFTFRTISFHDDLRVGYREGHCSLYMVYFLKRCYIVYSVCVHACIYVHMSVDAPSIQKRLLGLFELEL